MENTSGIRKILSFAIPIATLLVPLGLWYADKSSKSVSVEMISQTPLRPMEEDAVPGLSITINGAPLNNPYFSVFKIQNNGDTPIISKDFEAPLAISTLPKTDIASARVTAKTPKDIDAEITWDKQNVSLQRTLLNPGDTITLSIITTGNQPNFTTKARIVGIPSVQIYDATNIPINYKKRWFFSLLAIVFSIPAAAALWRIEPLNQNQKTVVLRRRTVYVIALIMLTASVVFLGLFINTFGINTFWGYWLSGMAMFLVASYIGTKIERTPQIK